MSSAQATENGQKKLIQALRQPRIYPHSTDAFAIVETHISWVILCGPFAYKIKKAVNLGFLDFSSLSQRKHYCGEELRLNRRLAPALYLEVVPITGTHEAPALGGTGEAIEYAVKMRRFEQDGLCDRMLSENRLQVEHIDHIVETVAGFHQRIRVAPAQTDFGNPPQVHAPVEENFAQIRQMRPAGELHALDAIEHWSRATYERLRPVMVQRKQRGCIRECHGDMHLGNMAWVDEALVIFDGIEFNENLYWIDVMSEVAFLCMDLEDHHRTDFAYHFLNGYLERTGDYEGLQLLRYYLVYRAMVRAKVAAIRSAQSDSDSAEAKNFSDYLHLARSYIQPRRPFVLLTHGLSGSGKSTFSAPLAERLGAIRIRSDRERQRLFGTVSGEQRGVGIDAGIYGLASTERTYGRLEELTERIVQSGYSVIVDATFSRRTQRDPFRTLAQRLGCPLRILSFQAPPETLHERVRARMETSHDVSEADLEVLEHQLSTSAPLQTDELSCSRIVDTETRPDIDALASDILAWQRDADETR